LRSPSYLIIGLVIELDFAILAEPAFLQELTLLSQDILDSDALVREDFEVIGNEMAILAARASDQGGPEVVCLFRDTVRGAMKTLPAGERLRDVSTGLRSRYSKDAPYRRQVLGLFARHDLRLPVRRYRLA